MLNRRQFARRSLALLVGPALLYTLGCSDDGVAKRYPVSGTVEHNGKPLAKARINFYPKGQGGQGASGDVENGQFSSMTTISPGDGVLPGEYYVTLSDKELDSTKIAAESEKLAQKHGMGKMAMIPPEVLGKAGKQAKGSIHPKYENPGSSPLSAKVEEKSNSFKFEVTD